MELQPDRLMLNRVGTDQVLRALDGVTESTPGGFYVAGQQEYLIRGVGRVASLEALGRTVVGEREGVPILLDDVATVHLGEAIRRGEAAVDGQHAVVLKVQKQPQANTLELTARVDQALDELATSLPPGLSLYRKGFRQADFIAVALSNVTTVLRDGAILVAIVLAMFLVNWRTTAISLAALPLSLLAGLLVLQASGASINTMTLGGFAIAIGELVDDAIIDVENVYRRLRENAALPLEKRRSALDVVYDASREIRSSVVFATAIILLVFAPLFFLSGIEGRLLRPLGVAYVTSIAASLVVALTITPVLCSAAARQTDRTRDARRRLARAAPEGSLSTCGARRVACARAHRAGLPRRCARGGGRAGLVRRGASCPSSTRARSTSPRRPRRAPRSRPRTRSSAAWSASSSTTRPSRPSSAAPAAPSATSTRST